MENDLTRRAFIKHSSCIVAGLGLANLQNVVSDDHFSFAMIADCQYMDADTKGKRYYRAAKGKLESCVTDLNKHPELRFTIHLGDFIDTGWKCFDELLPVYDKLKMKSFQVLGNHDFAVSDAQKLHVPKKMGLKDRYYQFKQKNCRFIVLDGNDLSYLAWPKGHPRYKETVRIFKEKKWKGATWNGAVGEKQMVWLEKQLIDAGKHKENVVIFCHFPIVDNSAHDLWNAKEVLALLKKHRCVKAYINGHNHVGDYHLVDGIHCLTVPGMINTKDRTSYALVKVTDTALVVDGVDRCPDYEFKFR